MNRAVSDGSVVAGPDTPENARTDLLTRLCLALLIVTLWLATRPYLGIFHDSRFYTVEALNRLLPGRFSDDLYFAYGSQGQFTIFSFLYAPLLSWLGLSGGNLTLTIAAEVLWLGGLWHFCRALFGDSRLAVLAMVAAILLPPGSPLPYGEQFITPRLLAEALILWAWCGMLRKRTGQALALLFLALLVHPLTTLPGIALYFLYEARRRPILWIIPAISAGLGLGLAVAGIQPFSRIFVRFDPAWFDIVRVRADFCFVTLWGLGRWIITSVSFALGVFSLALANPKERQLVIPVLAIGIGGLLLSAVGGDLLRNVLIFDIQTWRFLWPLALVANIFSASLFFREISTRRMSRVTLAVVAGGLASLMVSKFFGDLMQGAVVLMIVGVVMVIWEDVRGKFPPLPVRLILAFIGGLAFAILMIGADVAITHAKVAPGDPWAPPRQFAIALTAGAAILIFFCWRKVLLRKKLLSLCAVSAGLVLAAGWLWDQRTPWIRFVGSANPPPSLTALLPDKPIYWEDDVTVPWFLLKHASYFACDQGTGVLFSRGTAIAYQQRYKAFEPLQTLDFRQHSFCPLASHVRTAPLRHSDLAAVCSKQPGLGALVLIEKVADTPYKTWVAPVKFETLEQTAGSGEKLVSSKNFYVYSCSDFS